MCQRVTCSTCGKPDWSGCGAHVEVVLGNVPKPKRCDCRETGKRATPTLGGFFANLFGASKS